MIQMSIRKLAGSESILTGATKGEVHLALIAATLNAMEIEIDQPIILFDFSGVDFVSSSYLRAVILPFVGSPFASKRRSLDVFPVLHNFPVPSREELSILCEGERSVCVEAVELEREGVQSARLHGTLEHPFKTALQGLQELGSATAEQLAENCPHEGINLTAWNNRLAELFRNRLATRNKQGRFWNYRPIMKETTYGR